jgi:hypothetical protein
MLAEILLLFLEIDWHYHNSGPEKVRTANSKIFWLDLTYLSIFRGPNVNDSVLFYSGNLKCKKLDFFTKSLRN